MRTTRVERAERLRPRDPWFGVTFEEAPIRRMRDAQFVPLIEKLRWLEEMNRLFPQARPEDTIVTDANGEWRCKSGTE